MKITSYAVARPQYYDRGAVSTFFAYNATLGNHAATTRWTTTIASGKKLLLEQAEVFLLTASVAATPLRLATRVSITDGTNVTSVAAQDQQQSASLTTPNYTTVYPYITVYTGEIIYGTTFNDSLTGTVFMATAGKGTTFQS